MIMMRVEMSMRTRESYIDLVCIVERVRLRDKRHREEIE